MHQGGASRNLQTVRAAPRCGVIPASPAPLDIRRIRSALAGHELGCEIEWHEEITSTSDRVRALGFSGHPHGAMVMAESQTGGRGRRDNKWTSEPRMNLLFSVLLRPSVALDKWARLATLAALGLSQAIEEVTGIRTQIKWPNDLLIDGRKCCGILAEMFGSGGAAFMVLGAGINANVTAFPDELRNTATSLKLSANQREVDRTQLVIASVRQLGSALHSWDTGFQRVLHEVRERSFLLGKRVRATTGGGFFEGTATGLNDEGWLMLRLDDGREISLGSVENVRPV